MRMSSRPAPFEGRRTSLDRPHLTPLAVAAVVAAWVAALVAWGLGSGVFLAFHDRTPAEDRIASWHDTLQSARPQQALTEFGRSDAARERVPRAEELERRSGTLDATTGGTGRASDLGLRAAIGPNDRADAAPAATAARRNVLVEALLTKTEHANARLQTALAALGLAERDAADSGGPFVPLSDTASRAGIDASTALTTALDLQRRLEVVATRLPLRQPVAGPLDVTSGFGARRDPFLGKLALHTGVDLREAYGSAVSAVASGTVTIAGTEAGYGSLVEIDHGNGYATRYAHLSAIAVVIGQKVAAGAVIGQVGTSGRSTGPHLHYEIRIAGEPVDPARYLDLATAIAAE